MGKRILKHLISLLHVDYVQLEKKWNYRNVISPYYRIYFIDGGEGVFSSAREKMKLETGYLYIIPSFTLCDLRCHDYLSQYFIHFFEDSVDGISLFKDNDRSIIKVPASPTDIANIARVLEINPGRGINRSDNPKVYEHSVYYKEYQELNNRQNDAVFLETQGILLQLISRFLAAGNPNRQRAIPIPSKIANTIHFIQLHMEKKITVSQLAKQATQNADYFSRLFFKYTGQRPLAYIQQKRIERAQYLMVTTNLSIFTIAQQTGFDSLPYFARIFKKVTSFTPGEYKIQNQSFAHYQ